MAKLPNPIPGIKVNFSHFRDGKTPAAVFAVETVGDRLRSLDVVAVPIRHFPSTHRALRKTRSWARRRALEALGVT